MRARRDGVLLPRVPGLARMEMGQLTRGYQGLEEFIYVPLVSVD